jgi:LmbE family N-acetylglucosaminyl deacetylase
MGVYLFLSPHLDDAVLSCGGLIHSLAQSGERVVIVTAMAGEPQSPLPDSTLLRAVKAHFQDHPVKLRRAEDAQAAHCLGAQVYHLPVPESAFRTTRCGAGDWIPLYPNLDSPFKGFNSADDARVFLFETRPPFPEIAAIYAPMCVDVHIDHQLVRDWALILTGSKDAPVLKFYEEYPHARSREAVQKAHAAYRSQKPPLTLNIEVMPLTAENLAAKLKAMGCYRSHFHVLWNDQAEMEKLAREYMVLIGEGTPAERFWRVVR